MAIKHIFQISLCTLFLLAKSLHIFATAPIWYTDLEKAFPLRSYIRAVGDGASPDEARISARQNIADYFTHTLTTDSYINQTFQQISQSDRTTTNLKKSFERMQIRKTINRLAGLCYTEPCYEKNRQQYVVCAYILRENIWNQLQPEVESSIQIFENSRKQAESITEPLLRILTILDAINKFQRFYEPFATLLAVYPERCKTYTSAAIGVAAERTKSLQEAHAITLIFRTHSNSESNAARIHAKLQALFSSCGFTLALNNGKYQIITNISDETSLQNKVFTCYPQITTHITRNEKAVASFSWRGKKIAAYTKATTENLTASQIEQALEELFLDNLRQERTF